MNFEIPVTAQILASVSKLDQFRGQWGAKPGIPDARLRRIREAARVQSVAASCRLSGIRVSDNEVAGLLRGDSPELRDAAEILGYAAAVDHPLPASEELLTADHIKALHATLQGKSAENPPPSPWRSVQQQREAFDAEGRATGRVFSTLPPRMIEQTMEDLLTWLEYELRAGEQHPILVVGTFVLGILAVSPFESRNGRLARLLIPGLLHRAGYAYIPYASIERQIEDLRLEFHSAFDEAQTRLWHGEANLEPWLTFLLEVLDRHRDRVRLKAELETGALSLTPLQQSILETVREHGSVDAALLLQATGANRNTLKDNLRRLVERQVLEKTGQRRGTRYRFSAPDRARAATGVVLQIPESAD